MKKISCLTLAFLLVFQIFAGPISANAEEIGSTYDDVAPDVIHTITATKDGVELEDIDNYRPVMGELIDLSFEFTLPAGHNYGQGSTLTYSLPAPLKPASGSGVLSNEAGETYAAYKIDGGNVVITFNDKIRFQGEQGSGGLETKGYFEIKAKFEAEEGNTGLQQELTLPGSDTITLNFQPVGGKIIDKSAEPENGGNSSSFVTWTANVNTVMDDLGNEGIAFTDTLEGNHTYDPDSLVVTRLELGNDGSTISSEDVTGDYKDALNASKSSFTLKLPGKYAYKIVYKTLPGDTDKKSQTLKNNAVFNGQSDSKSATIQYGDPLLKTVSQSGERADWTIKVNGNRKTLAAGLKITDTWDSDKHELVPGSFKVNRNADFSSLGLSVAHTDQGFVLTLGQEINEEFTIIYSTKPKDLVTKTINITNKAVRDDQPADKKTATAYYSQNVLSKTNSNINYQAKTVDWEIVLNRAGYTMDNIVLTDTFVYKNLKIIDSTFKVKMDGKDLGYTRVDKNSDGTEALDGDKKGGFTLTIPGPITKPVTVTFTTEYDVRGVANLDKYENKAGITWKTGGKDYSTDDVTSTVTINNQQKNKGYKTGEYNYQEKRFKWSVGINYNFDTIANPIFTDTLSESQVVDRDSVKVYKLDLSGGGNGEIVGDPLIEGTDYTLTPAELANTFTITFADTIKEPYRIIYESQNKDDYYAPAGIDHTVTNNAALNGGAHGTWTKTVTVDHTDKLITKGFQQEGTSAKLHWTMNLNWGQSLLDNVVITDIVGKDDKGNPNQMVYKDSFKIYEMNFSGTNKTPTKGIGHTPGTVGEGLYYVTFGDPSSAEDPDSTFKITFNEPINKAYIIEYDTYFLGASGETLENQAKLSYTSKVADNGQDEGNSSKSSFTFSGYASTEKGRLEITKVDKDDENKKLSGAVFELWSAETGGFLIELVSTDTDGVYKFLTKVGQSDYYLKETKAPEGYSLDASGYKTLTKVTIKDNGDPKTLDYVEPLVIKNTKLVQAVKLTKVDENDNSKKLAKAKFTLHNSNDEQAEVKDTAGNVIPQPFETDEFGEITVNNLSIGTYYFKEISAPAYYLLPAGSEGKTENFTITDNQIDVQQVTMKNTQGRGKIIIKKVDGADETALEDVEFTLTKKSLDKFSDGSLSITAKTNEFGIAEFSDLPYDTYIIAETSARSDYVPNPTPQEVVLNESYDKAELVITIKNTKKDHSVKLTKYNANKTLTLQGAIFELRKEFNGLYEILPGIAAEQLTTDEKGVLILKDLPAGKYQLIETKAPAGYRLNIEPLEFEIEENQTAAIQLEKTNSKKSSGGGTPSEPAKPTEPEQPAKPAEPQEPGKTGPNDPLIDIDDQLPQGGFSVDSQDSKDVLPKTGGAGVAGFYISGLLLIAAGTFLRRKLV